MARAITTSTKLFGMIAMSMGMITKTRLEECLEIQRKSENSLRLGEVMLMKGILTEKQVRDILAVQKKMSGGVNLPVTETRMLIGEIMVRAGYIDREALTSSLRRQQLLRETGLSPLLGELLIAFGKLTPNELQKALAAQAMFPQQRS